MTPDTKYENLYHIQGCDQWKTVAFDFEFTAPAGFARNALRPPTLQMAFAYTYVPSANDVNSQQVHRRLRVYTVKAEATESVQDIYLSGNPDTIMSLISHKIIRSAFQEGVLEAKVRPPLPFHLFFPLDLSFVVAFSLPVPDSFLLVLLLLPQALLQDWIVISLTHYNEEIIRQIKRKARSAGETPPPFRPDVTFSKAPNLASLPRCVLGLLKTPLLNLTASSSSPLPSPSLPASSISVSTTHSTSSADYWTFLECLYTGLEPHVLRLTFYPTLQLLETPESLVSQQAALSSQEVRTSTSSVFFYDSYHLLYVFYTHQAVAQQLSFPPPRDSKSFSPLVFLISLFLFLTCTTTPQVT
jgi:hypothetical protein